MALLPILPRAQAPIAGGAPTTAEWFDFFSKLRAFVDDNEGDIAQIDDILARLEALENEEDVFATIQGPQSVTVFGSLESGNVTVQLLNDLDAPGNTYYYGTGPDGVKGWSTVASTITATQPGIELVTGSDGVTDIRPDDDLEAVEGLSGTGFATRTASNAWATRTHDDGDYMLIVDGAGLSGDPLYHWLSPLNTYLVDGEGNVLIDGSGNPLISASQPAGIMFNVSADEWTTITSTPYATLMSANSIITAGSAAGTYAMTAGGDGCVLSGADTAIPLQSIYIDSADYPTLGTLAPKLRIRVQFYTNDTAPTGNYTFGLYPITRPGTSGGSGVNAYTLGTVVTGSDGATFTAPAADGLLNAVGADFALPSNGHYVIGVVTTATVAANSNIQITASLQMRNA